MASMFALANPKRFMDMSEKLLPWLSGAAALALVAGFVLGFLAPPDYQQGTTVKIMFLHVPAAWTAMMAYGLVALMSFVSLIWRHALADVGSLLGMGCAADIISAAAFSLSWLHRS